MAWFAVRTIYAFGVKDDGKNVYEERIVAFEADEWAQAMAKARAEADSYALEQQLKAHPVLVAYEQDGDALVDGYELWSELFESPLDLGEFYATRYSAFDYSPPR